MKLLGNKNMHIVLAVTLFVTLFIGTGFVYAVSPNEVSYTPTLIEDAKPASIQIHNLGFSTNRNNIEAAKAPLFTFEIDAKITPRNTSVSYYGLATCTQSMQIMSVNANLLRKDPVGTSWGVVDSVAKVTKANVARVQTPTKIYSVSSGAWRSRATGSYTNSGSTPPVSSLTALSQAWEYN